MTILVQPDPPREGEAATVTVTGPGPHYYSVAGSAWTELPIDEETGTGTVIMPPGSGGTVLDISDRRAPTPDDFSAVIVSSD